ncbi:MAG: hypothetical protein EHM33_00410 [Chloroflexi bacterium]|nr:MAG: hypothetical protein EHM33_00410 [Chloroflexota bacterium]
MSFPTTYNGWIAYVRNWIGADEYSDAQVGQFLDLAQMRMNRELSSYHMEQRFPITILEAMVGNPISLSLNIPSFNRIRLVSVRGVGPLDVSAINEMQEFIEEDPFPGGDPKFYAIDADVLHIYPWVGKDSIVDVFYYEKIIPLSDSVSTNTFTVHHPDTLLYAACMEAAPYMVEDERIQVWEKKYVESVAVANDLPNRIKMGSTPLKRQITGLS